MSSSEGYFPHLIISGDARGRGLAYGEALRDRIHQTFSFYNKRLFAKNRLPHSELSERAERMREIVRVFNPEICDELDAIAEAADLPQWQIYLLNARTEILNAKVGECTALGFPDAALIGQTWDWFEGFEELGVLVTYERPDGSRLLTFTEPGMLAKIGLNDAGIGVCLNFLEHEHRLDGLPIHVLIRAILDCSSIDDVRRTIDNAGFGKSSHLLIADDRGEAISIEFLGHRVAQIASIDGDYLHTNHSVDVDRPDRAIDDGSSTFKRFQRGEALLRSNAKRSLPVLKSILEDEAGADLAINNPFHRSASFPGETIGCCATFVIDLNRREMLAKKGPGTGNGFRRYCLNNDETAFSSLS